jgi:DNA-binding CsgD family transcriptional regulator/tetratricopeptide (TPR) repeat protein
MVGRESLLAAVVGLLEQASAGQGQCILLAGEAGLGKSRLVAEAKHWAAQHGLLILEGNCLEPDSALPYTAFVDLLHDFHNTRPPGAPEPLSPPLLSDGGQLLSGEALPPDAHRTSPGEPAENKRRLFQALEQWLNQAGGAVPRLVVIEDVHWADEASLEFLHYFSHRLAARPVALLLTYRAEETAPKLARFLARLERQRLATELTLAPLGRAETVEMLRLIFQLRRPVRTEFLNLIYGLTEGNPLFIEEVLKSLVSAGDIFFAEGEWDRKPIEALRLPGSLQFAVRERTEQLSSSARHLLQLAAVAGRRFDFALLKELTSMDEQTVLGHIQELVEAQLVNEVSAEEFAFRHALTREAVYATLLKRQRLQFHGLVAEALERLHGADAWVGSHLADLAYHYREAANWPKALVYARRAGEQAHSLYAPNEAAEHFTRAIEAARHLNQPPELDLLRRRGQAYETLGEFERARADYELGLRLAHETQAAQAEWQTLIDLGFLWAGRDYTRTGGFFRQALERARAIGDPLTVAHSLNRMGNWLTNIGRSQEGLQAHGEALDIFRREARPLDVAATHDLMATAYSLAGDGLSAQAQVEQAIEHFRQAGDKRDLVSSLVSHCILASETDIQTWTGQTEQSCRARLAEAQDLAEQIGWLAGQALVQWTMGFCLSAFGELGEALARAKAARQTATEIEHRQWTVAAEFTLGQIYTLLLAPEEALRHVEAARPLAHELGSVWWTSALATVAALAHLQLGQPQAAMAELQTAARALGLEANWPTQPPRTLTERYLGWAWAEASLASGRPADALAAADRLIDSAINPNQEPIPHLLKLKGEALAALTQFSLADIAFGQALQGAQAHQARPLLWQIHRDRGRLAQRLRRPAEAASEFNEARAAIDGLAGTLEPGPLRQAFVTAANGQLPPPRATSKRRADKERFGGLTERERQVAALVATGQSNRAIAASLVLSERTIKTHVANILSKLDLTSRAQIAAWAAEHGLAARS